ncbi:MAG: signal peptidase I [Myxococcota bacterium]
MPGARSEARPEAESRGRPAEPPPDPKKVLKRARELVVEAERLLRKKAKKVPAEAVAEVSAERERLVQLLPAKRAPLPDAPTLLTASIELDSGLTRHFGKWRKTPLRELVESVLWALGLALIIRSFFLGAFSIPSISMYPTLEIGDHVFIDKISYGLYWPFSTHRAISWNQPARGDIIVFEYRYPDPDGPSPLLAPSYERDPLDGEDFIKRVIGLPGDRVRLDHDRIILNGQPIQTEPLGHFPCPRLLHDNDRTASGVCACDKQKETIDGSSWVSQHFTGLECSPYGENDNWPLKTPPTIPYLGEQSLNPDWPDVVVPPGHVLVMGDNRDASRDGRFWGFVPFERIKGKAFVIWLNWDAMSRFGNWLN